MKPVNNTFFAVVLAGERPGGSAIIQELGLAASVLIDVAGKSALARVIDALETSEMVDGGLLCGGAAEVSAWRLAGSKSRAAGPPSPAGNVYSIARTGSVDSPLGQVISERGSTRRFERAEIPFDKFAAVLSAATATVAADFLEEGQPTLLDPYLIVNGVQDLPSGSYFLSSGEARLEELKRGEMP